MKCIICGKPILHGQIINKQVVCKECADKKKEEEHENQD